MALDHWPPCTCSPVTSFSATVVIFPALASTVTGGENMRPVIVSSA
jgi:hypothetical protein